MTQRIRSSRFVKNDGVALLFSAAAQQSRTRGEKVTGVDQNGYAVHCFLAPLNFFGSLK
jgi:hypothetical protein